MFLRSSGCATQYEDRRLESRSVKCQTASRSEVESSLVNMIINVHNTRTGYSVVSSCAMNASIFQPVKRIFCAHIYPFVPAKSYPPPAPSDSSKTSEHSHSAFFSRASNFPIRINKSVDWLFTWFDADRAASNLLPTILASSPYYNIPLTSVDSPLHELWWDFIGTFRSLVKQDTDDDRAFRNDMYHRNIPEKGQITTKLLCWIPSARILKLGILERGARILVWPKGDLLFRVISRPRKQVTRVRVHVHSSIRKLAAQGHFAKHLRVGQNNYLSSIY